ncbi:MAG: hypothetical protein M0T77_10855 [Actinomycetota bacterium]|nr:hypothetical protein [Actinomycetota bacterium]
MPFHSPEFYLSKMGWLWLAMIAFFMLGIVLWFGVGLGVGGFAIGAVPLIVARNLWDRNMRGYTEAMRQAGSVPFSVRDWSLIGESLVHVAAPSRPARSKTRKRPGPLG